MNKYIKKLTTCGACIAATFSMNASAVEYFTNGSFEEGVKKGYSQHGHDGWYKSDQGYQGKGVYFKFKPVYRNGGNSRVEMRTQLDDVQQGASRWYAFSFKVVNDSFLDSGGWAIVQQFWAKNGIGPKVQFYINKGRTGDSALSLGLTHTINCTYTRAGNFVNAMGEKLCSASNVDVKTNGVRKMRFDAQPIVKNKWYHIRLEMIADSPASGSRADGRLAAAIKPENGHWKVIQYTGSHGKQSYVSTFTHEMTDHMTMDKNYFKFGFYGSSNNNVPGGIYFDELHSNDYFSALPNLYKY